MHAGQLDRVVDLLRADTRVDGFGGATPGWYDFATVRANKKDVSDAERERATQVGASITTRFTIRWALEWADLSAADRVRCEGLTYDIGAVKEIDRRRWLEISATARVDGAS
jgi:SPP1 family predicted phage head-tail adaptor